MSQSQPIKTYRGTWEELMSHRSEIAPEAVLEIRVYEPEAAPSEETKLTAKSPNQAGLETLRQIAELKKGMPESDPSQTDRIIRQGRAGAMYGDAPTE